MNVGQNQPFPVIHLACMRHPCDYHVMNMHSMCTPHMGQEGRGGAISHQEGGEGPSHNIYSIWAKPHKEGRGGEEPSHNTPYGLGGRRGEGRGRKGWSHLTSRREGRGGAITLYTHRYGLVWKGRSHPRRSPSGKSCLFANIKMIASFISLSLMMRWSSCLASSILSLSAQSTTNISPCVPV